MRGVFRGGAAYAGAAASNASMYSFALAVYKWVVCVGDLLSADGASLSHRLKPCQVTSVPPRAVNGWETLKWPVCEPPPGKMPYHFSKPRLRGV